MNKLSLHTLKIGNMCCSRCIVAVTQILNQLGIKYENVDLGFAEIYFSKNTQPSDLELELQKAGFLLLKNKDEEISDCIKVAIHKIFIESKVNDMGDFNLRNYLESQLNLPYKKFSEIFSLQNQRSIENYYINYRIEKVKSLISDTNDSFSEIAFKLGYKSLSYLSRQFKALEGISMHDYKLLRYKQRKLIDRI